MTTRVDEKLRFMANDLDLRAYRQQLLSSNIANADTPNYKAKDIDFAAELHRVQQGGSSRLKLEATSPRHLPALAANPLGVRVMYRQPIQPSIDGNTVDMDVERGQFTNNAIHYQFVVDRVNGFFRTMLTAIRGQ
ncbi:MAG TPA: flagellar basal body rod protein FlgB [Betaproteobacteria bacterium]|nr:flagellar basal body rod protein FlgB [Betaproteobacteria bacterium]